MTVKAEVAKLIESINNAGHDWDDKDCDCIRKAATQILKLIEEEVIGEDTPELRADFVQRGLMGLANQNLGQEMLRANQRSLLRGDE